MLQGQISTFSGTIICFKPLKCNMSYFFYKITMKRKNNIKDKLLWRRKSGFNLFKLAKEDFD